MTFSNATTRKVPVVFRMPEAKVGRGHVLPDLCAPGASDLFVTLPRGGRARFGMIAFAGIDVSANDMLERWRETLDHPADEPRALGLLSQYIAELQALKIGTVVSVSVTEEGILRLRVEPHRPKLLPRPKLP